MADPVTRREFGELVAEVNGEKVVTRHILEQTRRNGDDLAALKTRVGRVEEKVDLLDRKVDGLIKDLPRVVGDTMREVMRESGKRK